MVYTTKGLFLCTIKIILNHRNIKANQVLFICFIPFITASIPYITPFILNLLNISIFSLLNIFIFDNINNNLILKWTPINPGGNKPIASPNSVPSNNIGINSQNNPTSVPNSVPSNNIDVNNQNNPESNHEPGWGIRTAGWPVINNEALNKGQNEFQNTGMNSQDLYASSGQISFNTSINLALAQYEKEVFSLHTYVSSDQIQVVKKLTEANSNRLITLRDLAIIKFSAKNSGMDPGVENILQGLANGLPLSQDNLAPGNWANNNNSRILVAIELIKTGQAK